MGCLGVHFSITAEQAAQLRGASDDDELLALVEEIEEEWADAFQTDKAWDALHRCLSNGTLNADEGEPPLNKVFFGGELLNRDDDYFVVLVTPAEVKEIADALANIDGAWLRSRYIELPFPDYQGEKSDEDCEYTLSNFERLPEFFARAASQGRHVIFTVSQ